MRPAPAARPAAGAHDVTRQVARAGLSSLSSLDSSIPRDLATPHLPAGPVLFRTAAEALHGGPLARVFVSLP